MESKHFILAAIYLGPFLLAIVMPGWRTLGALAAACAIYAIWLFVFKENETGGISLTIEKMLYYLAFFGWVIGMLTRGATLIMQQYGLPLWAVIVASVAGALAPAVFFLMATL